MEENTKNMLAGLPYRPDTEEFKSYFNEGASLKPRL